jgi:hypothetical protein
VVEPSPTQAADAQGGAAAIAFFIFNRPDTTARVFERIAMARPARLLVVADGPRPSRPGEAELCARTRAVIDAVDWECEVRTLYSDVNLGCRARVASGLSWVFEQAESAIILEDDCLPDPTFFRFCDALLERYRHDERIALVSGINFQPAGRPVTGDSYYYSCYAHVWGWASWRRVWKSYDVAIPLWPQVRQTDLLLDVVGSRASAGAWRNIFDAVHAGAIDTWDYQLTFSCWVQHRLCIVPRVNLVTNIGFGEGATHTTQAGPLADIPSTAMTFPLLHPLTMTRHRAADRFTQTAYLERAPLLTRVARRAARLLGAPSRQP